MSSRLEEAVPELLAAADARIDRAQEYVSFVRRIWQIEDEDKSERLEELTYRRAASMARIAARQLDELADTMADRENERAEAVARGSLDRYLHHCAGPECCTLPGETSAADPWGPDLITD